MAHPLEAHIEAINAAKPNMLPIVSDIVHWQEGNSRGMQVFTKQLAQSTGRDISLRNIPDDKLNYCETMKVSAFGNPEPLNH